MSELQTVATTALEQFNEFLASLAEKRAATAERERIQQLEAAKIRTEREERATEDKRKAKQAHRAKIHGEAKGALVERAYLSDEDAARLVQYIRDGKIPHVSITY